MPLHPLTEDDPRLIGGHRLLARLGAGGMGTVYLARTPAGRTVALKAAHPALAADPEFVTRFRRETETVRALGELPHTPPFAGAGTDDDGRPWLATAYVVGPSLAEAVGAHGPWPEESVRSLGARLATGLDVLHRAGVVHRDLKPSNILLMPAGPLLVDFGIAHVASERLTDTGAAPGTPAYMAPEQLLPDGHAGPPCDVFALACVLTYTACGLPPFGEGAPGEVLYRVTHQEPELAAVPDELRPLLADCLAKEPERRPTAAVVGRRSGGTGWFGDRLPGAVLADIADRTARVGDPPPPRTRPGQTRPTRRRLLTGVAAVALAGAGGAVWATHPEDERRTSAGPLPSPSTSLDTGGAPSARWEYRGDFSVNRGVGERAALIDGTVLVPAGDHVTHGIDARRGTLRWTAERVGSACLTACGTAAVIRSTVRRGRLAAVEAADGRVWYSAPLGVSFDLYNDPVFTTDGRTVYVIGHEPGATYGDDRAELDRHLLAYDVTDRRLRWRRRLPPSPAERAVGAVAEGVLVFLENDAVTGHRADTGAPLWRRALSTTALKPDWTDAMTDRTVTAGHGIAFVTGRGCLCLDLRTGRTRWSLDPENTGTELAGDVLYGGATIDGATIYLTLVGQDLMAVRSDRRKLIWNWERPGTIGSGAAPPPLLAGGYVFPQTAVNLTSPVEDAVAVDPRTHRTAWTVKSIDGAATEPQLLADERTLYVLRGDRLKAYPLI
ncbi:protein kinase [Streptomyces sp. NPDC051954]|uniref:serine/threonine-protein kinase n=1 Tax=Streptomyces sp. NPDC051954 TaxID=3155524 RepID=UPI003444E4BA